MQGRQRKRKSKSTAIKGYCSAGACVCEKLNGRISWSIELLRGRRYSFVLLVLWMQASQAFHPIGPAHRFLPILICSTPLGNRGLQNCFELSSSLNADCHILYLFGQGLESHCQKSQLSQEGYVPLPRTLLAFKTSVIKM